MMIKVVGSGVVGRGLTLSMIIMQNRTLPRHHYSGSTAGT
jgi:hypothetical protein